ncbi:LPS export ABC transporter periplasmic protein LptC [Vibrio nomapromontoriensis]|uniref:LPS export ABC transporter periplasmic protein LptC n=1 Tax=Vibrio nomapromontoriensis TaxID=2910246 RepID=UPI003D0B9BDB
MSLSRTLYTLLFIISLGCAYYLYTKEDTGVIQVAPNIELPAFSGKDLLNTSYSDNGVRSYSISSVYLEHFSKKGDTVFDRPVLKIYAQGTTQEWEISAATAILDKQDVLTLYDDVIARNLLDDSGFDTLSTDQMSIQLDNRDFWADTNVLMLGPQFETRGDAMKGNFADNLAELYKKVNSKYETLTP